ncbi:MAG: hypothetical protein ACREMY_06040, partial [bacterium]
MGRGGGGNFAQLIQVSARQATSAVADSRRSIAAIPAPPACYHAIVAGSDAIIPRRMPQRSPTVVIA